MKTMKLKKGIWSKKDLKKLRDMFAVGKTKEIALQLGRPLDAVNSKAYKLGLRKNDCKWWTKREIGRLKKIFPNTPSKQVAKQFGRTVNSIREKAARLGLTKTYWPKNKK